MKTYAAPVVVSSNGDCIERKKPVKNLDLNPGDTIIWSVYDDTDGLPIAIADFYGETMQLDAMLFSLMCNSRK